MNSKATSLLILSACACLSGRGMAVEPGPKVYVIQPGTDRRVYLADLSVRTESGQPVPMRRTVMRTGRFGEPIRPKDPVDPSHGTLVLEARKHDITGRLELTYDPDPYFWKQKVDPDELVWVPDHDQGYWRPNMVYERPTDPTTNEKKEKGPWDSWTYPEYKEKENGRVADLQEEFLRDLDDSLTEAVDQGLIDDQRKDRFKAALQNLLATDLKLPLDPALRKAVTDVIDEVIDALEQQRKALRQRDGVSQPADPQSTTGAAPTLTPRAVESLIENLQKYRAKREEDLDKLIRETRAGAPKPPLLRVMMERRYRVPVRRGGYCLPATGGVILPPLEPARPST